MDMGEILKKSIILIFLFFTIVSINFGQFTIARVKYDGGGDWYTDPTALENWLEELNRELGIEVTEEEKIVTLKDKSFYKYPMLFISGHGNIDLSRKEASNLRKYLLNGGFLYINDDYGLNKNIKREFSKVFSDFKFRSLGFSHKIFNCYYRLDYFPKVHKHDGKKPQLYAIYKNNRIVVLYTHEADIVDGLTDYEIFKDKKSDREEAMKFAVNMVFFILLHN